MFAATRARRPAASPIALLQKGAKKGVRHRRRLRPARLGAAHRSARGLHGAHEHPLCHARGSGRAARPVRGRCVVHFAAARAPGGAEAALPTGQVLCLIKPQFEAGKDKVGKKGVVREKSTHVEVLEQFLGLADELGFTVRNLTFSRSRGRRAILSFWGIFPCSLRTWRASGCGGAGRCRT